MYRLFKPPVWIQLGNFASAAIWRGAVTPRYKNKVQIRVCFMFSDSYSYCAWLKLWFYFEVLPLTRIQTLTFWYSYLILSLTTNMLIPLNPTMKIIAVITAILPMAYATLTATVTYPSDFPRKYYRCTGIWQTMKLNIPVPVYWHGIETAGGVREWNRASITPGAQAAANLLVQGSSISMLYVVLSLNIQL